MLLLTQLERFPREEVLRRRSMQPSHCHLGNDVAGVQLTFALQAIPPHACVQLRLAEWRSVS